MLIMHIAIIVLEIGNYPAYELGLKIGITGMFKYYYDPLLKQNLNFNDHDSLVINFGSNSSCCM